MQDVAGGRGVRGYGPGPLIAAAIFTPQNINTAQVLTEAWGIAQIIRSTNAVAGRWTVTLSEKPTQNFLVLPALIYSDTTTYHFTDVESISVATGTFIFRHRSCLFAAVNGAGPALADPTTPIQLFVYEATTL